MGEATDRPARHGLGSVVEGYMRRKLRHDVHPAFEAFRDDTSQPAVDSSETKPRSSFNEKVDTLVKQDPSAKSPKDNADAGL
jgi:hypothetical protein